MSDPRAASPLALRIRAAGPDDAAVAASVYVASSNAAFGAWQPPMALSEERIERWRHDLSRSEYHWWLAEIGSGAVGLAGVGPSRDPIGAMIGELDTIAVVPEYWRRGVGRSLMTLANSQLDRDGYAQAVLWTWRDYPAAYAFYPSVGWSRTGVDRDGGRQVCYGRACSRGPGI